MLGTFSWIIHKHREVTLLPECNNHTNYNIENETHLEWIVPYKTKNIYKHYRNSPVWLTFTTKHNLWQRDVKGFAQKAKQHLSSGICIFFFNCQIKILLNFSLQFSMISPYRHFSMQKSLFLKSVNTLCISYTHQWCKANAKL